MLLILKNFPFGPLPQRNPHQQTQAFFRSTKKLFYVFLMVLTLFLLQAGLCTAAYGPGESDEEVEALMRGPIHEAFADVSLNKSQPPEVILRKVPEPINEIEPETPPEGGEIQWIPGYWSWDEVQQDFIWVSGIWREIPPGRIWTPGYWMDVEGGSSYVPGYWAELNQTEVEYLPAPPEPRERGPVGQAVSPSYEWMDGYWLWDYNHYVWQSGYWYEQPLDTVWVSTHYVWTPRGYVFVRGYWDYNLPRRGVIYSPLYYKRPIYQNYGYSYIPSIILNVDNVFLSLFIRRGFHHYYFGNYHHARYQRHGFYPWYSRHATRYGYDPQYRKYRSHHLRYDRGWEKKYQRQFQQGQNQPKTWATRIHRLSKDPHLRKSKGPVHRIKSGPSLEKVKNISLPVRPNKSQSQYSRLPRKAKETFQTRLKVNQPVRQVTERRTSERRKAPGKINYKSNRTDYSVKSKRADFPRTGVNTRLNLRRPVDQQEIGTRTDRSRTLKPLKKEKRNIDQRKMTRLKEERKRGERPGLKETQAWKSRERKKTIRVNKSHSGDKVIKGKVQAEARSLKKGRERYRGNAEGQRQIRSR